MSVRAATAAVRHSPNRAEPGPSDLQQALLKRSGVLVQNFTENLMTYALGRRVEAADMPAVRGVIRQATPHDLRFSALVLGIVQTPAFRMKAAEAAPTTTAPVAGPQH